MLYVKMENGKAVSAASEYPGNEAMSKRGAYENRNDWPTMERAEQVAKELNEAACETVNRPYIATDSGPHVSPQFDVVKRPQVGDAVSYSFNGDSYPDGTITKITGKEFRIITTDTGSVYYRKKQKGAWVKQGGTWSLILGHHNERNPHF